MGIMSAEILFILFLRFTPLVRELACLFPGTRLQFGLYCYVKVSRVPIKFSAIGKLFSLHKHLSFFILRNADYFDYPNSVFI